MNSTPRIDVTRSHESRRWLYRRSRRLVVGLLTGRWPARRPTLERAARGFLRHRTRSYLARVVGDRQFALAVAAAIMAGTVATTATALPPVDLSDVAAGTGGFVINGIDPDDRSGFSVSGAGDVNGDGLADTIVGAWGADPGGNDYAGESYVVFGKAGTAPVSLSNIAAGIGGGFVINGFDRDDYSGFSVSGAGDVNGDGLADLIVGAYQAATGLLAEAGASYVVFGKDSTTPVSLFDILTGTGGFVIKGIQIQDLSGFSVAGAGDVNGDGLADLIVGARGAGLFVGESYVVFGKADTTAVFLSAVAAGTGGFVINGIHSYDQSGWSVSGAGDVNGDGLADVIVGAFRADPGGINNAGESYVVFGKADTMPVSLSDIVAGSGGFVISGSDPASTSGFSVSSAGDVNGDGLADLIVGAPQRFPTGNFGTGDSYVVFGKPDTTPVTLSDVAAGTGGFVINSNFPGAGSGISVSSAGDVNGDGLADVIVGAFHAAPGGNLMAGESYVVFGKADTKPVSLADVITGAGGFVINGIDPSDYSGVSVSGAGDVNGDGVADLVVGANGADPGGNGNAGESYVIFGKPPCPWDCADGDGNVGIVDFLALLADWGGPGACDFDGGGIGITDFLELLAHWGDCP